ncbi:MAG: hypothetical protein U0P45_03295 [Acidimicrobiales bacterium]
MDRDPTTPRQLAAGVRIVQRHRAAAEADLTAATGGASLCRTDGAPDAKRAEGALAAIAALHRTARRAPHDDPTEAARDLLDTWLVEQAAAAAMGRDWRDYRDGGVAALRSVLDDLEAMLS